MKTFLAGDRPIITGMLKSTNKKDILDEIRRITEDGAEAYGFQIDILEDEWKQPHHLKEIFDAMYDKPIYCTNYMRGNTTKNISWNTLRDQLLTAVDLGATLIDIPAHGAPGAYYRRRGARPLLQAAGWRCWHCSRSQERQHLELQRGVRYVHSRCSYRHYLLRSGGILLQLYASRC